MYCAGIDAGSRAIKIVVMDAENHSVVAAGSADQGVDQDALVEQLLTQLLEPLGLTRRDLARVVATGYARNIVTAADTTVTEISCHARGVHARRPDARTVVEIGGQDSKLLRLGADGSVRDFAMNDRCAAGTGRFLEVVAERLKLGLAELGEVAALSGNPAVISSMCVVFAETEIIGLLSSGRSREDIVAGVQTAIAQRVASMAGRQIEEPVVFTGGVALVPGMDCALSEALGHPVEVVPDPQTTGALGAALMACAQAHKQALALAENGDASGALG
jgi:predicted CoA-substrate-specific enzyme activase